MRIEYLGHFGNDLMVVNAARVSFNNHKTEFDAKDEKLIHYLAKNGHISPFFHPQLQVRVTVPFFIANQLKRHQIGLAVNEVSRRYVDTEPEFFHPESFRNRPDGSIKQGSGEIKSDTDLFKVYYEAAMDSSLGYYEFMIAGGVAPEMARMVLPQSTYTSWIWTGSLAAFVRIYKQRTDPHAQQEVRDLMSQLKVILEEHWPVSFNALMEV